MRRSALFLILLCLLVLALPGKGSDPLLPEPEPVVASVLPVPVALEVSPGGNWVAAGLNGLTLYDREGNARPVAPGARVRSISWAPAGDRLLAFPAAGAPLLVEAVSGRAQRLAGLHLQDWPVVTWSPDSTRAFVGGDGDPIYEVRAATGAVHEVYPGGRVVGLHVLPGDRVLVLLNAGCCGAQSMTLDLTTGTLTDAGFVTGLAISPDGRLRADSAYLGGQVIVTDLLTGRQQAAWRPGPEIPEYRLVVDSWSPDATKLAVWLEPRGGKPILRIIDWAGHGLDLVAPGWEWSLTWLGPDADVAYASRTEDGKLAVFYNGTRIAVHDDAQGLGLAPGAPDVLRSPDGARLAYALNQSGHRSALVIVDLQTGDIRTLPDSAGLAPLAWTPDGRSLLVAQEQFRHWDLPGGGSMEGWEAAAICVEPIS